MTVIMRPSFQTPKMHIMKKPSLDREADFSNQNALLEEIRKGNSSAFEYLFRKYYRRLCGYAAHFIDYRDIAEDIIQECFMKIWDRRELLKSISASSLLFAMVRNGCLDYLKHSAIVERHSIEYLAGIGDEEKPHHADFSFEPEHATLYLELEEQVRTVIDRLPCRCRDVFVLSRFEGLKNREISEKLQISVKAVENHITKALSVFTAHFKDKYPVDI
jgi:RNA polymerase sigma-70 factor (ECF subfamily)